MQLALFFGPSLIELPLWSLIYYGFWATTVGITVLGARSALARAWPVIVFSAICVGLALLRPLDTVAKNLIVAMATLSCGVVLANAAGASNILRLSALGSPLPAPWSVSSISSADRHGKRSRSRRRLFHQPQRCQTVRG